MITAFTATHASQPTVKFRFKANNVGTYKKPEYVYSCNGRQCSRDAYNKALNYFKKGRK